MDVVELFIALLPAPDIEVVESALSEAAKPSRATGGVKTEDTHAPKTVAWGSRRVDSLAEDD